MRLVFFGTGEFAVPALRALAPHVVLVVSQPDRPSGRGHRVHETPIKALAGDLGIPCVTPLKARDPEFVTQIAALDADALVVASYGQILSLTLLDSAKRGGINLHGSLLPKYRGAAPIQRAILDGETETGVTLMQMDKGMDTGDMITKICMPIGSDQTYGEVQQALAEIASEVIREWIPKIVDGHYPREKQEDGAATVAPKVEKAEGELRFDREAGCEYNRFRAFTPSPGAFMNLSSGLVKVKEARVGHQQGKPGTILAIDDGCTVALRSGSMRLLQLQPEGKKRMTGRDFANGLRLKAGDSLI